MTILIVDDEQLAVQSLLREAAQVFPPETDFLTASSGAQALELAASRPADIAFLDIEMPDMDGLELTLRLKQLHPEINIIFVTAYPAYSVSAWKLHASDYLLKPVDAGDLRRPVCLCPPHRFAGSGIRAARMDFQSRLRSERTTGNSPPETCKRAFSGNFSDYRSLLSRSKT